MVWQLEHSNSFCCIKLHVIDIMRVTVIVDNISPWWAGSCSGLHWSTLEMSDIEVVLEGPRSPRRGTPSVTLPGHTVTLPGLTVTVPGLTDTVPPSTATPSLHPPPPRHSPSPHPTRSRTRPDTVPVPTETVTATQHCTTLISDICYILTLIDIDI